VYTVLRVVGRSASDNVNGVGDAKIWTGSGISEGSTGPGYGRCDTKISIDLRLVLLASNRS